MKPIVFPDYDHSILNVTASILHFYKAPCEAKGIASLDTILQKNYRNVVLILVDALGDAMLKRHLPISSPLRMDQKETITSVFPSTTVAATTAVLTGKSPIQTGWLGWCQYFSEVDKNVVLFTNQDYYDELAKLPYPIASTHLPTDSLYAQIKRHSPDVETKEIFPAFREPLHDSFAKQCETVIKNSLEPGRHFTYVYWDKVDWVMHESGVGSIEAAEQIRLVEAGYATLQAKLPNDTLVLLIADHGQLDVCPIDLTKFTQLKDMLVREPSVESRAAAFFVKAGKHEEFVQTFNQYFRDYYVLYKTSDLLKMELYGPGTPHPRSIAFLGDFVAIATDAYYFLFQKEPHMVFKGHHAGLTADEMLVPLIIRT